MECMEWNVSFARFDNCIIQIQSDRKWHCQKPTQDMNNHRKKTKKKKNKNRKLIVLQFVVHAYENWNV